MRKLTFSLAIVLISGTSLLQVSAQQGSGQSVGASSSTRANLGLGSRAQAAQAHSQGALRSIGRGATNGGISAGAQLKASGAVNAGRSGPKTETQISGKERGLSLRTRARNEMQLRVRGKETGDIHGDSSGHANVKVSKTRNEPKEGVREAPWVRANVSRADWHLAQRLAVIDHQRDIAVKNGNEVLLQKADKLEARVRLQHEQRIGVFADQPSSAESETPPEEGSPNPAPVTPAPMSETPSESPDSTTD